MDDTATRKRWNTGPYTQAEDDAILAAMESRGTLHGLTTKLRRSKKSLSSRAGYLGLYRPLAAPNTPAAYRECGHTRPLRHRRLCGPCYRTDEVRLKHSTRVNQYVDEREDTTTLDESKLAPPVPDLPDVEEALLSKARQLADTLRGGPASWWSLDKEYPLGYVRWLLARTPAAWWEDGVSELAITDAGRIALRITTAGTTEYGGRKATQLWEGATGKVC